MNRCGSGNIFTNRILQIKCTFVQCFVIGWIWYLILDVCEPVESLNIYYQMYTSFVLFMRIIYDTNVIICVCLSTSQLVFSLPAVVLVSLPRLASTAAGAANSKGKEKDFSFSYEYAAVLKNIQKHCL